MILCHLQHFLVAIRNWKGSLGQLLTPVFIALLLLGFQEVTDYVLGRDEIIPAVDVLEPLPQCIDRNDMGCKTVRYCPKGVPWVDELMQEVCQSAASDLEAIERTYHRLLGEII